MSISSQRVQLFSLLERSKNFDYIVFDAIRDGKGKELKANNLLKLLKKINAN